MGLVVQRSTVRNMFLLLISWLFYIYREGNNTHTQGDTMEYGHASNALHEALDKGLPKHTITYINPTNIMVMLSGVHHIEIDGDVVTLVYTDATRQSKHVPADKRNGLEFFDLVSLVQAGY